MELANKGQLRIDIPDDVDYVPERFGSCFNCGHIVTDFEWCYGCKAFICKKCNTNMLPLPNHKKEDHLSS